MFCKKCGIKVEESWKVCPNCGTSLQEEQRKSGGNADFPETEAIGMKNNRPVYKKWWFWVFVIFIIIICAAVSGGDSESDNKEVKTEEQEEEKTVTDFSNIDMEVFLEGDVENITNAGFQESEDYPGYGALDGDVQISVTDGEIDLIMITGDSDKAPSFHGVKTGMDEKEAYELLADAYPAEIGDLDGKMLANLDTKRSVRCQAADGKISGIIYMPLTDSDIEEYQEKKEEALRDEYVFPDSNTRYLSEDEVRSVESDKLAIGRNEIFARHGYEFQEKTFQKYFQKTSWYKGTVSPDEFDADVLFNDFEKKNVELIKRVEDEISGVNVQPDFSFSTGTYVNEELFEGYQALVMVNYVTANWMEVDILTMPESSMMQLYGDVIDDRTIRVTDKYSGVEITLSWNSSREVTLTSSGAFTGPYADMFHTLTNAHYTLAPGF